MKPSLSAPLGALALLALPAGAQTALISGVVVDSNGAPIPNVDIDVINDGSGGDPTLNNDTGNPDGTFLVEVTPPGTYRVVFNPPQPPASTALVLELPNQPVNGTLNLGTVALSPGVGLFGRALNPGGQPVAGVDIDVVDADGVKQNTLFDNTNALGQFAVAVPLGQIELQLDPAPVPGQTLAPVAFELDLNQSTNLGDVALEQGYLVTGIVRRANGTPVVNADVDATDVATGEKLYTPGDNSNATGVVDFVVPQGAYLFGVCPPPGELLVGLEVGPVTVTGTTSLGVLTLQGGVLLSGNVLSHAGLPVAGVDIDAEVAGSGVPLPLCYDKTDAAGHYAVVVPTGTYDVDFSPPYALPLAADIHPGVVVAGPTTLDGDLPACPFITTYGVGIPGTGGLTPVIGASGGTPRLGNESYQLELANGRGGATALLRFALGKCPGGEAPMGGPALLARMPAGSGVTLTLSGTPGAAGVGRASQPLPVPGDLDLLGMSIFAQAAILDPLAPGGVATTPVACSTICP